MPYLIAYHTFNPDVHNLGHSSIRQAVVDSIADWIDYMKIYKNEGEAILLNVLEITDEQAKRWDGSLCGMRYPGSPHTIRK